MKTYRYLYYNLYRIWLRKKNEVAGAHINAIITITFFLFLNIVNIRLILLAAFRREIIHIPEPVTDDKIYTIIIVISIGILNYMLLGRKKQHDKIVEEFKNESEKKKKKGMLFTILFLVISIGIPFYIFLFTTPIAQ